MISMHVKCQAEMRLALLYPWPNIMHTVSRLHIAIANSQGMQISSPDWPCITYPVSQFTHLKTGWNPWILVFHSSIEVIMPWEYEDSTLLSVAPLISQALINEQHKFSDCVLLKDVFNYPILYYLCSICEIYRRIINAIGSLKFRVWLWPVRGAAHPFIHRPVSLACGARNLIRSLCANILARKYTLL